MINSIPLHYNKNDGLSWSERVLLGFIKTVEKKNGVFDLTNEKISEEIFYSKPTIQLGINKLVKIGLVKKTECSTMRRVLKAKRGK